MTEVALRLARPDDAEALAALGCATFRETFVEAFAIPYHPEDLPAFREREYAAAVFARFIADPAARVWVAERGDELVGYAYAAPASLPHPDVQAGDGELKRLYVGSAKQGAGSGDGCWTPRWTGSTPSGPARSGSGSGRATCARNACTRRAASPGPASTTSPSAACWTASSSCAAVRLDRPLTDSVRRAKPAAVNRAELLERLRALRPWLESRGVSELKLFGSFARDEAGPDSDVDLLVGFWKQMGWDFFELELELAERLGRSVDLCTPHSMNRFVRRRALGEAIPV